MGDEDIVMPPCPSSVTTSKVLYEYLGEFRAWVISEQKALRSLLPVS